MLTNNDIKKFYQLRIKNQSLKCNDTCLAVHMLQNPQIPPLQDIRRPNLQTHLTRLKRISNFQLNINRRKNHIKNTPRKQKIASLAAIADKMDRLLERFQNVKMIHFLVGETIIYREFPHHAANLRYGNFHYYAGVL